MSLNIRPLSEDLKIVARDELNEAECRLAEDITKLREWILKQPHLKARIDDQFLLAFLRGSKHSLEKAKSKIDHFYTIKTMLPEIFKNLTVNEKLKDLALSGALLWPPKPAHTQGPEVAITRFDHNFDFNRFKLMDIIRFRGLALEFMLQNVDSCVINGFVEIFDLAKISFGLYAQTDFVMMKKLSVFFEKGIPLRMKAVHIINCPKEGQDILIFVKSLIIEKYRKLFFVHKSLEELHKCVPRESLPLEYGGTNGTIAEISKRNAQDLAAFNYFYEENNQYGVDERLRPNRKIDEKSLFGLEGSFRKLDID